MAVVLVVVVVADDVVGYQTAVTMSETVTVQASNRRNALGLVLVPSAACVVVEDWQLQLETLVSL